MGSTQHSDDPHNKSKSSNDGLTVKKHSSNNDAETSNEENLSPLDRK